MPIKKEKLDLRIPQQKMPRLGNIPQKLKGPKGLRLTVQPERRSIGPGDPPPGFVTATTSASEWINYWASAVVFHDPPDPRKPPYFGGRDWGYQKSLDGGRREQGGAVIDYIYWLPGETIGLRLQTARFHDAAGPAKEAMDRAQLVSLSWQWGITIKDLDEQEIIADRTGEAAVRRLVELLGGRERINPGVAGTYRQVRAQSI